MVSYRLCVGCQSADELGLAVELLRVLCDFFLGLVKGQLLHDDVLIESVADAGSFVEVGVCEVVGAEEESECEEESDEYDGGDLGLVVGSEVDVGVDEVVVVVGDEGDDEHGDGEVDVLGRFVVDLESAERHLALLVLGLGAA